MPGVFSIASDLFRHMLSSHTRVARLTQTDKHPADHLCRSIICCPLSSLSLVLTPREQSSQPSHVTVTR